MNSKIVQIVISEHGLTVLLENGRVFYIPSHLCEGSTMPESANRSHWTEMAHPFLKGEGI